MALEAKNFEDIVTFTRASEGTFVDSDGLIKTALPNQPRFDHDPSTLEPLGLLVEEQRTNLYTNSGSLVNTFGASGSVKSTNDLSLTPNGTFEGVRVFENDGNLQHGLELKPNAVTDKDFTLSIFAKKVDRDFAFLGLFDTDSNFSGITVDLNTAEVTRVNGSNLLGFKAEKYSNGWVRISCSYPSNQSNRATILFLSDTADRGGSNGRPNYQGDPANSMLVWGYQAEQGSFPTSYIPTNGSEVTRVADRADVRDTIFDSLYNLEEGTVFIEVDNVQGSGILSVISTYRSSTDTNRGIGIDILTDNTVRLRSALGATLSKVDTDASSFKAAFSYTFSKAILSINGILGTDEVGGHLKQFPFLLNGAIRLQFGTDESTSKVVHIKDVKYFPRALSDSELIELTTPETQP